LHLGQPTLARSFTHGPAALPTYVLRHLRFDRVCQVRDCCVFEADSYDVDVMAWIRSNVPREIPRKTRNDLPRVTAQKADLTLSYRKVSRTTRSSKVIFRRERIENELFKCNTIAVSEKAGMKIVTMFDEQRRAITVAPRETSICYLGINALEPSTRSVPCAKISPMSARSANSDVAFLAASAPKYRIYAFHKCGKLCLNAQPHGECGLVLLEE
jgi:hypothetical protein